jgi:hypothetical protein
MALLVLGSTALGLVLGWGVASLRLLQPGAPIAERAHATPKPRRFALVEPNSPAPKILLLAEEKSVAERVRELAAMPSSLEQKARILEWARTLSGEQCRTAALAARRMKEPVGRELLETVAIRWAEIDPVGAVEYALSRREANWDKADQGFIENVMATWVTHDAAHVEEWVNLSWRARSYSSCQPAKNATSRCRPWRPS